MEDKWNQPGLGQSNEANHSEKWGKLSQQKKSGIKIEDYIKEERRRQSGGKNDK